VEERSGGVPGSAGTEKVLLYRLAGAGFREGCSRWLEEHRRKARRWVLTLTSLLGSGAAMLPLRPFECDMPMLETSAKVIADEDAAIACDELKKENLSLKALPHLSVP